MAVTVFAMQGCSEQSPFFDSEPNRHNVIITKPPMRVIMTGNIGDKEHEQIMQVIDRVDKVKYHNYKFNENEHIVITIIDNKGDSANVNLHYTTPDTQTEESKTEEEPKDDAQ
jgi:hypothetical protein